MEKEAAQVLAGRKALVVGLANDQSIAYGCAKAFRAAGADVAITWLNDKGRPHVEPLAMELGAAITHPLDVTQPGELEKLFETIEKSGSGRVSRRGLAQNKAIGHACQGVMKSLIRQADNKARTKAGSC